MSSETMNVTAVFASDLAVTIIICAAIVFYLAKPLRSLLIELCGTAERANFWLVFSNVALVLVPVIFALDYAPEAGVSKAVVFEIAAQRRHSLIGFLVSFASLGVILLWFIPRGKATSA